MPTNSEEVKGDDVSTGALSMPAEPDTTAQSIAAGILSELGDEPLVKRKPGRPKKAKPAPEEAEVLPPEHLLPEEDTAAEPEDEPTESPADDTDDVEENEPTELDAQLMALANEWGVPRELFDGAESVGEAQRTLNKLAGFLYQSGAAYEEPQNGQAKQSQNAQHREAIPAEKPVQTTDDDADSDLAALDDDEPIKKVLLKRIAREKALEAKITKLEEERRQSQETEFQRVQNQIAQELHTELLRIAPDLFGNGKTQTREQYDKLRHAWDIANTMIRGAAQSPNSPVRSIRTVAQLTVNAAFADELANKKILAKREQVEKRQQRRSVGAPSRQSRSVGTPTSAKIFDGPMADDPDILATVRNWHSKARG